MRWGLGDLEADSGGLLNLRGEDSDVLGHCVGVQGLDPVVVKGCLGPLNLGNLGSPRLYSLLVIALVV